MRAEELLNRLSREADAGQPFDWRQAREDIHKAHDAAVTEAERVFCLCVFNAVMDSVERQGVIENERIAEFRKIRQQDYNLLLIKEALIGCTDRLIHPDKMAAITRREVAAGRMSPDEELHKLAVVGDAPLTPYPARKNGLAARIVSWFK